MGIRTSREQKLLGAVIASGVLVLVSHTGGPISCASTAKDVEMRPVGVPLRTWQQPSLFLVRPSYGPADQTNTAEIRRGTLIEGELRPNLPGDPEFDGVLAGFDPYHRTLLVALDKTNVVEVPYDGIEALTVVGESKTGAAVGNGALIGGLSGLVIGAATGAAAGGRQYGAACALGFGLGGGLIGTPIGAGIGAAAAPARSRYRFRLGPGAWQLQGGPPMPGPAAGSDTGAGP